jgi:hypothetical protein
MNQRICVILEDDIHKKLRTVQAKLIQENQKSFSFSDVINHTLRQYFY